VFSKRKKKGRELKQTVESLVIFLYFY